MKVLHFTKYLNSTFFGGLELVTSAMARAAVSAGNQVSVVGVSRGDKGTSFNSWKEIPLRSFGEIGPVSLAPGYLFNDFLDQHWDVIHVHLPNPCAELALLLRPDLFRKSSIVPILHAGIVRWPKLGSLWERSVHHRLLAKSKFVVASSGNNFEAFANYRWFIDKAVILPFPPPDPMLESTLSLNGPLQILAIGRLVPYKGFDVLIEAMAQIGRPYHLTIIGKGPEQKRLQSQIAHHRLEDKVLLAGELDERGKNQLLAKTHLVVVPSVTNAEAFGLTIAEAFSYGKAVIATNLPTGVADLVRAGDCGAVVEVGSANHLREAILRFIQNPELLGGYGTANFAFYRKTLTEKHFFEKYNNFLQSLGQEEASTTHATVRAG